jgi:ABC-2 type transport system permease protein
MLNIYKRFWQTNWAEQWQYRGNLVMYLAYWLVSPIIYLSVWTSVARAQGSVQGITAGDFAAYYLVLLFVEMLTSSITIHLFGWKIQEGVIANELMLPVHPVLTNALMSNLAFKALMMIVFVPIWILLVVLFQPNLTMTPQSLLFGIPIVMMGFLLNFLFDSSITLIAFWTTRVWSLQQLSWGFQVLLGGSFVPLTLMPVWVQAIAQFLPYQLWISFPTLTLLNKLSTEQLLLNLGLQLFWVVVMYVIFAWLWRRALQRFSAVGA